MSNPQENDLHYNTELHSCYVLELPKSGAGSLPVDFYDVAFYVPIVARDRRIEAITNEAANHYIRKRGHPGREKILKVIDIHRVLGTGEETLESEKLVVHNYDEYGLMTGS